MGECVIFAKAGTSNQIDGNIKLDCRVESDDSPRNDEREHWIAPSVLRELPRGGGGGVCHFREGGNSVYTTSSSLRP